MKILALDPGPEQTGFTLCAIESSSIGIVEAGVEPNSKILEQVHQLRFRLVHTDLAIEMIASYGMAVGKEVFETCVWIGRFQQAYQNPECVRRVYRRDVKLHLCGNPRAKDTNIWQALVDRFGEPGTKKNPGRLYGVRSHARAALAVAVTAADLGLFGKPQA